MLAKKILKIGYYWNMMETDCVDFLKSCHDYQTYVNLNHVPPSELYQGGQLAFFLLLDLL